MNNDTTGANRECIQRVESGWVARGQVTGTGPSSRGCAGQQDCTQMKIRDETLPDLNRAGVTDGISTGGGTGLIVSADINISDEGLDGGLETGSLGLDARAGYEEIDFELEEVSNFVDVVKDREKSPELDDFM